MRRAALIFLPVAIAVVVILTAARVLPACAVGVFPWADACLPQPDAAPAARLDALEARRAALEAEISTVQRRVAALPACRRVARTPPPPAVVPQARPQRPPPPAPGLDPERWQDRDIGMLEGCWNLDSDYTMVVRSTGARRGVRSWQMCFDGRGGGRETQVFTDGTSCAGPVQARFRGDRLDIDETQDVPCNDGTRITRRRTRCSLMPDGRASCSNMHPDFPRIPPVEVILRR
jgi:hypothetical protein